MGKFIRKHQDGSKPYRKPTQMLLTQIVQKIDCGTKKASLVDLAEKDPANFYGHFIVIDEGLVRLDAQTAPMFAGKVVKMRMSYLCPERNGCCVCYGTIRNPYDPEEIKKKTFIPSTPQPEEAPVHG
jgi:hypothetical protein